MRYEKIMWKKISEVNAKQLALYSISNPKSTGMISWKTSDNIDHLCSFDNLDQIKAAEYESNTIFTIWEKNV